MARAASCAYPMGNLTQSGGGVGFGSWQPFWPAAPSHLVRRGLLVGRAAAIAAAFMGTSCHLSPQVRRWFPYVGIRRS